METLPTPTRLTAYERTNLIGVRAEQLARGAQAFVEMPPPVHDMSANETFYAIAERELAERRIPLLVKRSHHGRTVVIRNSDLKG